MSLRRFALIAPLILKHKKQNKTSNVTNTTPFIMTTPITGHEQSITTTTAANIDIAKQTQSVSTVTNTTILSNSTNYKNNSHRIIDDKNAGDGYNGDVSYTDESNDNSTDDSNEIYTNIIDTYAAGDGLQTVRASFGLSGLIGHSPGGGISSGGNVGGSGHQTYPHTITGNANLLLCGAMLSVVTTILCVVCYCCHRNIKKRTEAAYRQQHQWLESEPNMEIYSVEQSYETSGHFLTESSDGFATAILHHEPPPSYDAVVAMQEQQLLQQQLYQQQYLLQQQQQQTHLQHSSPPPGYRSTLAVNEMPTPTICASAATNNMDIEILHNGSNSDLNGSCNNSISGNSISDNSCNNLFACSKPNAPNNRYNSNNNATFLNMKKALNAQSCCSLQRAEVENMWKAAAAAVATRASRATSSPCGATSLTNGNMASSSTTTNSNRGHISPLLLARKSLPLPLTLPAKFTTKANGRRYLPHHSTYYRRGCPLCGKFRYDADETHTLSVECALDAPTTSTTLTIAANTIKSADERESVDEECSNSVLKLDGNRPKITTMDEEHSSKAVVSPQEERKIGEHVMTVVTTTDDLNADKEVLEQCACTINILESSKVVIIDSDCNGNNSNNTMNMLPASTNKNAGEQLMELSDRKCIGNSAMLIDQNANGQTMKEEVAQEAQSSVCDVDGALIIESALSSNLNGNEAPTSLSEYTTLNDLNANSGIIRVDMSKIIDQTGLPTYEAAAKLESSGYV